MAPREERRRTLVSLGRQFSLQGLSWLAESSDPNPSPDILPRSLPGAPPHPPPRGAAVWTWAPLPAPAEPGADHAVSLGREVVVLGDQ